MLKMVIGVTVGLIVASAWYVSPILKPFPQPTGSYSVGTQSLYVVDQHRNDPYSSDTGKRAVMARIWYPSSIKNGEKYFYLGSKMPIFQNAFAGLYHVPQWVAQLLWRNIPTNAYLNVPLATTHDKYPVILFSHGLLGLPSDMYVVILQELASHGYIVVGIDHPYFNIVTIYSDGRVVSSQKLDAQFQKMSSTEQKEFQNQAIEVYKADMKFIIDELTKLNEDHNSTFYHHLDLDRIGVMGHSAGGTAAIEFCRIDNRCKAAINLDGWYDQAIGHEPLKQPLLLMFGSKSIEVAEPTAEYLKRKELTREQYYDRERSIEEHKKELCKNHNCSIAVIPGVEHGDFSDGILLKWPLRSWSAVDGYKAIAQINQHILNFFDNHLPSQG